MITTVGCSDSARLARRIDAMTLIDTVLADTARQSVIGASRWLQATVRQLAQRGPAFPLQLSSPGRWGFDESYSGLLTIVALEEAVSIDSSAAKLADRLISQALLPQLVYTSDSTAAILGDGRLDIGATASALRALMAGEHFERYAKPAEMLFRTIARQLSDDPPPKPFERLPWLQNRYQSRTAALALATYASRSNDTSAIRAARAVLDQGAVSDAERLLDTFHPVIAAPDIVALSIMFSCTGDIKYRDAPLCQHE
jgi:hypothetical protein